MLLEIQRAECSITVGSRVGREGFTEEVWLNGKWRKNIGGADRG